jgi:hypothetical protein
MILFDMALSYSEVSRGDFVEMFVLETRSYIYGQVLLHRGDDAVVLMNDGTELAPMKGPASEHVPSRIASRILKRDLIDSDIVVFPDFKEALRGGSGIGLCITSVVVSNKPKLNTYVPSKDFYEDRRSKANEGIDSQGQIVNRVGGLSFL